MPKHNVIANLLCSLKNTEDFFRTKQHLGQYQFSLSVYNNNGEVQ